MDLGEERGWVGREIWNGREGDLTPQVGAAIRAEVQFFAPISEAGGAVVVCAVASAALERSKNCWKELHDEKSSTVFFQTQLFLSNGRTDSGKEDTRAP